MKVNQRIKFWVAQDDSGDATNLFGVESHCNWFDVQYYPEQISAVVIWTKGLLLAQQVYKHKDGHEARGGVFDISKKGIRERIDEVINQLRVYDKSIDSFLEGVEYKTLDFFFEFTTNETTP